MDLKNLPSRYSKVSDEMEGSKEALDMLKAQTKEAIADSRPSVVEDIRQIASRPGFITWKSADEPWFKLKGSAKITGKTFDLDTALQQKLEAGIQKQGKPVQEFPNVKPLIVEAPGKDNDDKSELGQVDASCCGSKKWLYLAGVFSLGLAAGWWLAKRA